jgi:hypothetical protein
MFMGVESWIPSCRDGTPAGKQCELLMDAPDFRALLDQVADEAEKHVTPYQGHAQAWGEFLDRIDAALSQPAPEPPAPTPNRPLWRTVACSAPPGAIFGQPGVVERRIAAELRAIAEAMEDRFVMFNKDTRLVHEWLLAEADRAEAGG